LGVFAGPDINESGLVLSLDAANRKSYPTTGTTWTDLSGLGNTGTLVNGVGYNGSNGGALSFDGANDYVTIPTSSNWSFGLNDFAVDMWIYPTSYASSSGFPTILQIPPYYSSSPSGILLCLTSGGNLTLFTNTQYSSNVIAPLSRWTHCVYTRLSGILNYYAQTVAGSTANLSTFSITNSQSLKIGADLQYNSDYFIGRISTVKIYNRALSAAEVQRNFLAMRGRFGI
jgi:hypothetical protein